MRNQRIYACTLLLAALPVAGDASNRVSKHDIEPISAARALELDTAFPDLLQRHGINTAGIAVIKGGRVNWQNHYGQQAPGVPASSKTLFNVGSITKTVTADTVLQLVAEGKLSLDEPMSAYWVDPDLKDDPRRHQLTPRMALTHRSGFMNWRFFSAENKLSFVNPPGETFGYSGEGLQYLARYVENKLATPFEQIVGAKVFGPLGLDKASMSVHKANFDLIARPVDAAQEFYGYYCYPTGYCRQEGDFSAAGDMVITVEEYAKFLIASMQGDGLNEQLLRDRSRMQSVAFEVDCSAMPQAICPDRVGYGLGWNIVEWADDRLIGHDGTDWSLVALTYYYLGSGDGLIVFFNAPNKAGMKGMVETLGLLDPDSPKLHEYQARATRD